MFIHALLFVLIIVTTSLSDSIRRSYCPNMAIKKMRNKALELLAMSSRAPELHSFLLSPQTSRERLIPRLYNPTWVQNEREAQMTRLQKLVAQDMAERSGGWILCKARFPSLQETSNLRMAKKCNGCTLETQIPQCMRKHFSVNRGSES